MNSAPRDGTRVLLWEDAGYMAIVGFWSMENGPWMEEGHNIPPSDVIAWQPLPAGPEDE